MNSLSISESNQFIDPAFPRELECKIFELAAQDSLSTCAQLLLVARRVYYWLKPTLYSVLILNNTKPPSLPLYVDADMDIRRHKDSYRNANNMVINPALSQYAHMIKHVLLRQVFVSDVLNVIGQCTNIQNLALWTLHGDCSALIPILEDQTSLTTFSFDPSLFFRSYDEDIPIPFNLPMFRNVTHLEVVSATPSCLKWRYVGVMPALTHLAMGGVVSRGLVGNLLRECERLRVLVVYSFPGMSVWEDGGVLGSGDLGAGHEVICKRVECDERFVDLNTVKLRGMVDLWERGARGGVGFWELVDEIRGGGCSRGS